MDLSNIKSQRQVLDVFENLFHKYSNFTELPKLKKRRLSQVGNSKICGNKSNSSLLHQSSIQPFRSGEHLEEQARDETLHPHAKDQGSLSSGVFSIDSDIDNLNDDDGDGDGDKMGNRIDPAGHEENSLSSEAPSEAGSGIVERSLKEVSFLDNKHDFMSVNHSDILQGATEGSGKLTDDDVLFMMHKPRLKKRRKKPPWQRRKLDMDDLWVKGQHLQFDHGSDHEEEGAAKLFLDRNLRRGKISLQNYICAMRKSRKGKKRLNNSSRNRSASKRQSLKDTSSKDHCSKKEVSVGNPQKATSFGSEKKKQTVKTSMKKSTRYVDNVPDNTSDTSEKDFRPRLEAGISSRAFPKAKRSSDTASSVKEEKAKRTCKSQRSNTKPKESKADDVYSKARGRPRMTDVAKKCRVSGGRRDSSASKGTSSCNDTDRVGEVTRTPSGHPHRSRQNSRTSSERTKQSGNKKSSSAPTPAGGNRRHHYDKEQEESGGSQESVINFISLTPRKSRKLSRRRQRSEEKRKTDPLSTSDSSDFDGHFRSASLHPRGSLLASDLPVWEDEEEIECRPLFGKGNHCGGVWNAIIEESS